MATYVRALIGFVAGLGVGLVITVVVVLAKVGLFVNTPRAAHPFPLLSFFAIPAAVGGVIGLIWRRGH